MWNFYLLLVRLWLGYSMIKGGQIILSFFSSQEQRDYLENWFGNELGLPFPLFMAFLAKGTEFLGGVFVSLGMFTRISSALLAVVMLVATLTANVDYTGKDDYILPYGVITLSFSLFACLLILSGGGKYSLDRILFKNKNRFI